MEKKMSAVLKNINDVQLPQIGTDTRVHSYTKDMSAEQRAKTILALKARKLKLANN